MPTFGYTSVGADTAALAADYKRGSKFNLPVAGTVTQLSAYMAGGASSQVVRACIYSDTFLSPGILLAQSSEVTIGVGQAAGWVNFAIVGGVDLAAGNYFLVLHSGATTTSALYYYTYRWGGSRTNADAYSDGASNSWGSGTSWASRKLSIYATYGLDDVRAPEVEITAPVAGAVVSGASVALAAAATDNVGVVGVQFKLDGIAIGSEDTSAPYAITWDSTAADDGSHQLTAVARDAAGNSTESAPVTIQVGNVADEADPVGIVIWPPTPVT